MTNKITSPRVLQEVLRKFSIGCAPFRVGSIEKICDSQKAFNTQTYNEWIREAQTFAVELGIKIETCRYTLGVYGATSNKMELSALISIIASEQQAKVFAALMGLIAPEIQHSVMLNTYDENGLDTEHRITFKKATAAQNFIEHKDLYGVDDMSFDPKTNTAIILDAPNNDRRFDIDKFSKKYERDIKGHEQLGTTISFTRENNYETIIEKQRNFLIEQNKGNARQYLINILHNAINRLDKERGKNSTLPKPKKRAVSKMPRFAEVA